MREAGFALGLIGRADVIPDRHGDNGRLVILVHDDGEAVVELEFFEWDVDRRGAHIGGLGSGGGIGSGKRACAEREHQRTA